MSRLSLFALAAGLWLIPPAQAVETAVTLASAGGAVQLPATLIVPEGQGPFPAIVIMHDCSGLGPRSSGAPRRWADRLAGEGYAILIPDSFGPRDLPNGVCTDTSGKARDANAYVRAGDAYRALAYLRTLPVVDGGRVGIMGGSHGGFTTLASMYTPVDPKSPIAAVRRDGFAAAVGLYPACGSTFGAWKVMRTDGTRGPIIGYEGVYQPVGPLLILIGEKDDWTPAEPCRRLAEASQGAGYPVKIKVYPGAHHSFDSAAPVRFVEARNNINSPTGKGATTGGNAEAWDDAKSEVSAFFARYLKP